jgi:hypothetical protein
LAIGINIFLYGLSGPFAAALMERFGLRRTTLGGLTTIGVGVLATPSMHQPWHYGLRGLSLIYLPFAFVSFYGLSLFAVFYGLDWIATVPPTIRLTANTFGSEKTGMMYGWITAIHQLGGAFGGPARRHPVLAPKRQAKAWTLVPCFARRAAASDSDSSLRLAAQEDHEIRALAGLRAQLLVRDDQGRSRRCHLGDTVDVLRNHNPVKRGFRVARLLRYRLDFRAFARPRMRLDHVAVRTSAV